MSASSCRNDGEMAARVGPRGGPGKSIRQIEAQRPRMRHGEGGEVLNQPRLARGADAVAPGLGIDTRVPRPRREIATGERYRGGARPQGGCDGGWRDERQGERSEEHTSELQSHSDLVCRLLLEKKKTTIK